LLIGAFITLTSSHIVPSPQEIRHDTKSFHGWRLSYAKHEDDIVKQQKMYAHLAKLRDNLKKSIEGSKKEPKRHMYNISQRQAKAQMTAELKSLYAKREAEYLKGEKAAASSSMDATRAASSSSSSSCSAPVQV